MTGVCERHPGCLQIIVAIFCKETKEGHTLKIIRVFFPFEVVCLMRQVSNQLHLSQHVESH